MIETIKTLIADIVPLDQALGDDDDLLMSGVLDSISAVKLIALIEERLSITIPATDTTFENFQSVRAIADYLQGRGI